mmetsp:Transcript_7936/g.8748  ORF Transcript_7936/g.8748 Transcript_7936/m.8748 type:complete len:128 (-) Transcript_7936:237-620(-)
MIERQVKVHLLLRNIPLPYPKVLRHYLQLVVCKLFSWNNTYDNSKNNSKQSKQQQRGEPSGFGFLLEAGGVGDDGGGYEDGICVVLKNGGDGGDDGYDDVYDGVLLMVFLGVLVLFQRYLLEQCGIR